MSTVGSYRGPNIVTRGLVLHLDAASPNSYYSPNGGTVWKDVSGNGNDGTLVNGTIYQTDNNGRFYFDGTNDKVTINSGTGITLGQNMTADLWVNLKKTSVVLAGDVSYSNGGYLMYVANSTTVYSSFDGTIPADIPGTFNANIQLDTWIHLAMKRYSGTVEWYQNGSSIGTDTDPGGDLVITTVGGYVNSFPVRGNIASFKAYNRALSAQEVLQNYNATKDRFGL